MPSATRSTLPNPDPRDTLRGMAVMLMAFFIFSGVDTMAKYLTQSINPVQVVWFRQLGLLAPVLVLLVWRGGWILNTAYRTQQITRGALAGISATCFILGVSYVPLADAVAVTFITPITVTVLGALLLRESVGIHRWAAVVVGFIGA